MTEEGSARPDGRQQYLLVPMHPTPNGRMHIGHASGAYLRADVIARHLRREGHDVCVISGSDAYENWIQLEALRSGGTPAETCWRFHALIGDDLRSFGVELDAWISPLDENHAEAYRRGHERLVDELAERGVAKKVPDPTPRSKDSGRYVIGVWLLGVCPRCGASGGGNACEECGHHYQPAEILEPRSRLDEGPLVWEEFESWYLTPASVDAIADAIADAVAAAEVSPRFADVAIAYLRESGGRVRLSQPGDWGIPSGLAGPGGVLSNPYYGFSLYCGEVYRELRGAQRNPFERGSGVVTVGLFGIDNTVTGVASSHALALAHGGLKPFDRMVTNYFLEFDGEKVSTSRRHGIWLGEILARTSVTADELRYHLAHIPLEHGGGNFTASGLVDDVNRLRGRLAAVPEAPGPIAGYGAEELERAERAVRDQGRHLDPGASVSLPAAVAVLDAWLSDPPREADAGWSAGLALLAEPFLPGYAGRLWTALGLPGRPRLAAAARHRGSAAVAPRPATLLTADEIARVSHHGVRRG